MRPAGAGHQRGSLTASTSSVWPSPRTTLQQRAGQASRPTTTARHHQRQRHRTPTRPNVLLVLVFDDLRPEQLPVARYNCSCSRVHTPSIASVAARGVTFLRAYTQAPQCCPTRNAFLTSRRPDHTRVFTNGEMSGGGPQEHVPPCALPVRNVTERTRQRQPRPLRP
jgi:hypothetical protein